MNENKKKILVPKGTTLKPQGLYHPDEEHDSCGIGFVADIKGVKSHGIIQQGLDILNNLEHRGAIGADPETGDGAGILMQMPDKFLRKVAEKEGFTLPEFGRYGIGFFFMPQDIGDRKAVKNLVEKIIIDQGQNVIGWRHVPVDESVPGVGAQVNLPKMRQVFIEANEEIKDIDSFERKLFLIRRIIDHRIRIEFKLDRARYYVPSFSAKTLVYKGMLLAEQVPRFFHDLHDQDMESAMAMVHMRFSTNTMPTWDLAQPFRMIAHNGEINTVKGNLNWMRTREAVMESEFYGHEIKRMLPIAMEGQSDSATFDCVLELLVMSGRSLPHAIMMMIPEAWSKNHLMDENKRAFYEFHAAKMEPWDGPAAVMFTDGSIIGATLDRNGLRPCRYYVTKDNRVILSSEAGILTVEQDEVAYKGKLEPGKIFLVDFEKGRIVDDKEVKQEIINQSPYTNWVGQNLIRLNELEMVKNFPEVNTKDIVKRQKAFGYTKEDINIVLEPMFVGGKEGIGSMGTDQALAVLSENPQLLFKYFKQLFAQVTNPPVDAIREEIVFELITYIGPEQNLLDEDPLHAHRLEIEHPVLTNQELETIRNISEGHLKATTLGILFDPRVKHDMRIQLEKMCEHAEEAIKNGFNLIIMSDRGVSDTRASIPSLLAVSGVHHHLIRKGLRTKCGIIIETGEAREVPHFALLCGYGANAINPYLAYETMHDMHDHDFISGVKDLDEAYTNYKKAITKGLFKIFSKMGISTLQSYCGAQIYEAVGLDQEIVDTYFRGTATKVEGLSLEMLEEETVCRHRAAFSDETFSKRLPSGGMYHYRMDGEAHLWSPTSIAKLQISTKINSYETFKEFSKGINDQEKRRITLRSLLEFDTTGQPIDINEVEPAKEIVKRFSTGAMSFGSISWEAHTTLAIGMNRIGAKSNTGEGGEDPIRFLKMENGDTMRSAIKQVASGRFGVTAHYLVNSDELQIKMAQGAKPGEGGQLPGFKVNEVIAKVRKSTPGVTLISPPPHHDIYSIEDLKQLIFDLKNINPNARISVKLVSEVGVGTVAAGVAKAHADHILISGHDGGTGASPISSIHYAGTPWEIGLSETQQVLVMNGLRDRIHLATDGKLLTGRDVVIAALLGADEFGFSTAPLVTIGCIMMRKCHLNTCPVGVATQDSDLRAKFNGTPESVVNYMFFVAEEVREYMAEMGFKKFNDMIGQVYKLQHLRPKGHWKARGLDFKKILHKPEPMFETKLHKATEQNHGLATQIDNELIKLSKKALEEKTPVKIELPVTTANRTVGAMLSGEIAKKYGEQGLPDGTIDIIMTGSGGQSFGCWLASGIQLRVYGEAQDYCGKGLSGGRLIVQAPEEVTYDPAKNFIIGNTCFYGATSGEAYINGLAGERFCVRNSGINAVVEGIGDHGCEYMTGGNVVILGAIGRNFAAGMSGGIAYIYDSENKINDLLNTEMVELELLEEAEDIDTALHMITRHKEYTKSKRAAYILSNWDSERKNFVKIIPIEYKKAIQKLKEMNAKDAEADSSKKVTIDG